MELIQSDCPSERKATLVALQGLGQLWSVHLCFGSGMMTSCGWALRCSGAETETSASRDTGCALATRFCSFFLPSELPQHPLSAYLMGGLYLTLRMASSLLDGENEFFLVTPFWKKAELLSSSGYILPLLENPPQKYSECSTCVGVSHPWAPKFHWGLFSYLSLYNSLSPNIVA